MDANQGIDEIVRSLLTPVLVVSAAMLVACLLACLAEMCWVVLAGRAAWSRSIAPRALRRAALALCGAALVAATPGTADAVGPDTAPRAAATIDAGHGCLAVCLPDLDGLRLPDLPASTTAGAVHAGFPDAHSLRSTAVVHRGDCLWSVAAGLLGPDAGEPLVARLVDAIYAGNRTLIGPDPDLVLPGTRLSLPEVTR